MKKLSLVLVMLLMAATSAFAQIPNAINFQAIARDAQGDVIADTDIAIQLTILDGGVDGTEVYREIRSLTTNGYGSFSFQIGVNPLINEGDFTAIDWENGEKYMKVDYDPTASLQFDLTLGTIEFATVPYAFAAGAVSYIDISGVQDGDVLLYNAGTGKFEPGQVTNGSVEWSNIVNAPDIPADLSELTDNSNLLFSGAYTDLTGLPTLFSGSWNDLADKPTLFSGSYTDLTDKPDFTGWDTDASDDFDGNYNSLTNLPTLFDGNYNSLSNLPTLFSGSYTDLANKPDFTGWDTDASDDFSGDYNDLSNTPTLFDGAYSSLTGTPTLNTANWNTAYGWGDHAGLYRANTWVPAWADVTGKPTFATVATSGSYNDLADKPTITDDQTLSEVLTESNDGGASQIKNIADPTDNQDAATKAYVDALKAEIYAGLGKVVDIDGNIYETVTIGDQIWMASDLRVTTYPNGTPIPHVTDNTAWGNLADNNTDDAYSFYDNSDTGSNGALYTYAAAIGDNGANENSAGQGVCPDGWHLPTDAEWTALEDYLIANGYNWDGTTTGDKTGKSLAATSGWTSSSTAGDVGNDQASNNSTGFSALPGGGRASHDGSFSNAGYYGYWWSATENSGTNAWYRLLYYDHADLYRYYNYKSNGLSVRCLRD